MSGGKVSGLATGREHMTATVAPYTKARAQKLAARSGLSIGRVLDLALDCLDVCEACDGTGRVNDRQCVACGGHALVPLERR